jgi:DNA-binding NtrC family response regulator
MLSAEILILNDGPGSPGLAQRLAGQGYRLRRARGAGEAKDLLGASAPDLLLLDLQSPESDAAALLSSLGAEGPLPGSLVLTASRRVSGAVACMRLGAYGVLGQPAGAAELLSSVAAALRSRAFQLEVGRQKAGLFPSSGPGRGLESLAGAAPAIEAARTLARRAAGYEVSLLVCGEAGTGKRLIAEGIHRLSARAKGPFVCLDCASLASSHEGELAAALDAATGGTLYLDEAPALPAPQQAALLKGLGPRVRVMAAARADLRKAVRAGAFREDLYYRLAELGIVLPPLRERGADLELLAQHFLGLANAQFGRKLEGFSPEALSALHRHSWPGNVRELKGAVRRAAVLAEDRVEAEDLPFGIGGAADGEAPGPGAGLRESMQKAMRQVEQEMIRRALKASRWNKTRTAKLLGIDYKTLYNKLKEQETP